MIGPNQNHPEFLIIRNSNIQIPPFVLGLHQISIRNFFHVPGKDFNQLTNLKFYKIHSHLFKGYLCLSSKQLAMTLFNDFLLEHIDDGKMYQ